MALSTPLRVPAPAPEPAPEPDGLRGELLAGLQARPRRIHPKFFYDERGSELFSRICEAPEYYVTRTEAAILREHAEAIADAIGRGCQLIEPGAGNCGKVRHILKALQPARYCPVDISGDYLLAAVDELRREYPRLDIRPVVADFAAASAAPALHESVSFIAPAAQRRVVFYPGSSIGNFPPDAAAAFLKQAGRLAGPRGGLLIGIDLHKDSAILNAAYNDAEGITAAFNRNILAHANRILGADFQPQQFDHLAFYNEPESRVEMHLAACRAQQVTAPGLSLRLLEGERIHTEYSYKYRPPQFAELAAAANFTLRAQWTDPKHWFGVQYYERA